MGAAAEADAAGVLPCEVVLYLLEPGEPPGAVASASTIPVLFLHSGDAQSVRNDGELSILPRRCSNRELAAAIAAVAAGLTVHAPGMAVASPGPGFSPGARDGVEQARGDLGSPESNRLTVREQEVLAMIAEGLPNKAIAVELGITSHTVKFHIASIMQKLGAASRTEAVTVGLRKGIILL